MYLDPQELRTSLIVETARHHHEVSCHLRDDTNLPEGRPTCLCLLGCIVLALKVQRNSSSPEQTGTLATTSEPISSPV